MKKPNIIYFHTHDSGRYVQPYGMGIQSPNIQKLSEEGVLFRNSHCACPTCSPSRAALLTGQYPHNNGMLGLSHRGWELNDKNKHLCNVLKQNGYETVLAGMQHVTKYREQLGYEIDLRQNMAGCYVKDVMPKVEEYLQEKHVSPFFLSVGFTETHLKYLAAYKGEEKENIKKQTKEWSKYIEVPPVLPDKKKIREEFADFQYDLLRVDDALGKIVNILKEKGIYDNTIIICTTDHGVALPRMKCTLTDQGTGVMLIIKGMDEMNGGKVIDAMVSHMDVFPTICEMIDIVKPNWLQGQTLIPLVKGQKEEIHNELFFEVTYHAGYEPKRAIRTNRWKYIKRFDEKQQAPVMANIDMSNSKQLWLDNNYQNKNLETEYLFDLYFDPIESCNLYNDPEYKEIKEELKNKLYQWMKQTEDPLLNGPIPLTENGFVEKRDAINPANHDVGTRVFGFEWNDKYL